MAVSGEALFFPQTPPDLHPAEACVNQVSPKRWHVWNDVCVCVCVCVRLSRPGCLESWGPQEKKKGQKPTPARLVWGAAYPRRNPVKHKPRLALPLACRVPIDSALPDRKASPRAACLSFSYQRPPNQPLAVASSWPSQRLSRQSRQTPRCMPLNDGLEQSTARIAAPSGTSRVVCSRQDRPAAVLSRHPV